MAKDGKRITKSESLTLRLNPRTRFILEFISRLRGQNITTVVERAVIEAGDRARAFNGKAEQTWKEIWDVSDGMRSLRVASNPSLFPTYEEEKRLQFSRQFYEFFYTDYLCNSIRRSYTDVIWENIDNYIEIYEQTKHENFFAAGNAMYAALKNSGLEPPPWPRASLKRVDNGENSEEPSKYTLDPEQDVVPK